MTHLMWAPNPYPVSVRLVHLFTLQSVKTQHQNPLHHFWNNNQSRPSLHLYSNPSNCQAHMRQHLPASPSLCLNSSTPQLLPEPKLSSSMWLTTKTSGHVLLHSIFHTSMAKVTQKTHLAIWFSYFKSTNVFLEWNTITQHDIKKKCLCYMY